jgi:hypothetical protein
MRSLRYLNAILTVLAVLLGLQLWTAWTQTNLGTPARVQAAPPAAGGIPDTGAQQKEMIDLLKQLVQKVQEQTDLWRSGDVHVHTDKPAASDKGR